jgi:MoxR-like ATPase
MTTADVLDDLRVRLQAGEVLLFLETFEEQRWELELADLSEELEKGLVTWTAASGPQPPLTPHASTGSDPREFVRQIAAYPPEHLFLLKDFHPYLRDPLVVRHLRDQLRDLAASRKAVLLLGPSAEVPLELQKDATVVELPLPGAEDLHVELQGVLETLDGRVPTLNDRESEHFVRAVLGLTACEARRAFARVLQGREAIDAEAYAELVAEKRHMVEGADLLEFFDLHDDVEDVGGLEGLKEWIASRADAFTAQARQVGISNPKGMLLLGVQGCGKSLTARATARQLGFPLIRLDLSALLESGRGASEQNLRNALRVVESVSPAVLWLEEIDKAFAGFDEEARTDSTMSRIVGRFLTWLQEHEQPVFVVATANNVSHLPPELLRRGRFDDIFFVDLPNFHERKHILAIHLRKRGWKAEIFDLEALATATRGYSGAELEQIVNSAIIEAHASGRVITQADLDRERELTVPLSVTMEDEIFQLREWARSRCRPATPEYRVLDVMEAEVRRGEDRLAADGAHAVLTVPWVTLAEHGQIRAAVVEYVRLHDRATFARLQHDLAPYLETAGEYGLVLRSDTRVVVWNRMSRTFVDLLADLIAGKRLYLNPVPVTAYAESDRRRLPVLEQISEEKLSEPVWLPTVLRLVPPPEGSRRFARVARIRIGRN